jgi:hypothetical protein
MKARMFLIFSFFLAWFAGSAQVVGYDVLSAGKKEVLPYHSGKPYTRWWWFASVIRSEDILDQLKWLKERDFGGVEIAFIYPVKRNPAAIRYPWLGKEWQEAVQYAKTAANDLGLGCDFTFGTLWPFGGTFVADSDRTQVWGDPGFKQPLRLSWTHPDTGNVLNHLDKGAFERYAEVMGNALSPALRGSLSALFCDSWEVETKRIWTSGFDSLFMLRFGYDIRPYMDSIYAPYHAGPRYDYMKLVSELVMDEFYIPFTQKAHELGALSRAQCAGAPVDLISAYASVDVPETEAMLYNPEYTRIVSSAAALSGKNIISSETFTCLYGWPAKYFREEQTADLKLVCDALFAEGMNQVIWHGMPYNPVGVDTNYFYATVHVGKKGSLTDELTPFNRYMTKVSGKMRFGKPYTDIAVYLPLEDAWITGEYPEELQLPWSWGAYELRYEKFSPELAGYQPLYINADFLGKGKVKDNVLYVNDLTFCLLYLDAGYLDPGTLKAILGHALNGLPVCLKRDPVQAGHRRDPEFDDMLRQLKGLPNVGVNLKSLTSRQPLVTGKDLPGFWCRTDGRSAVIFFANPKARNLSYPIAYGQSYQDTTVIREVTIHFNGGNHPISLLFEPYQSILLEVNEKGVTRFENINFVPRIPAME